MIVTHVDSVRYGLFLADRTGVVVYLVTGYWKLGFVNPILVSNGSYTSRIGF